MKLPLTSFLIFTRNYKSWVRSWKRDGVKYEKVTYYPRTPNHADPPFTSSKLLLVKRVKPWWGNPWWEKDTLENLGFREKKNDPVILKNTPDICSMLWRVKHLVKITPIKLPDKLPTADDLNGTYLHDNGTFYITPKIDPARYQATEKFVNDPKRVGKEHIKEKLRLLWLAGRDML